MESFSGSSGKAAPTPLAASGPHVVVECPSCKTKFAVESVAIDSIRKPKFHCSRCDAVFALPAQERSEERHSFTPRAVLPAQDPTEIQIPTRSRSAAVEPQSLEPRLLEPRHLEVVPPESKPIEPKSITSPATSPGQHFPRAVATPAPVKASDFSLSNTSAAEKTQLEKQEATPATLPLQAEAPQSSPRPSLLLGDSDWTRGPLKAGVKDHVGTPPPVEPPVKPLISDRNSTVRTPLHNMAPSSSVGPSAGKPAIAEPYTRPITTSAWSRQTYGLAVLSTPLIACFALLLLLSYSLQVSPQSIGGLITRVIPSIVGPAAPQIPPSALAVRGASLQFITLRTQEVIPVVSGTLVNRSDTSIEGVTIEGLGFNERGEVLLSSLAPLRSALTREKIADLTLDTVKKFQVSLSARHSSIAPGEEAPFSIALLGNHNFDTKRSLADIDLTKLKYFSARVFSVR